MASSLLSLLHQLLETNSERRLALILDNDSYHQTRAIHHLLEAHRDRVFTVWLPVYSPVLNLIEGVSGYLKRSALNNYLFGDIESLKAAIHQAFSAPQQHP